MGVTDILKPLPRRGKHNHEVNLDIVLRELMDSSRTGGVTLQHLANVCGVSKRHVYRYLRELEQMGIPLERPLVVQTGRAGGGRYKLKVDQGKDVTGETILIAALYQMLDRWYIYHKQFMYVKELLIRSMAIRNGFKLPLNFMDNSNS